MTSLDWFLPSVTHVYACYACVRRSVCAREPNGLAMNRNIVIDILHARWQRRDARAGAHLRLRPGAGRRVCVRERVESPCRPAQQPTLPRLRVQLYGANVHYRYGISIYKVCM